MNIKNYIFCALSTLVSLNVIASSQLKEAYSNAFKFGFAVNDDISKGASVPLQNIVIEHANTITLENSMKAEVISPESGVFNFEFADQFIGFGQANNMFMIGHTLVWHNQTPDWFFNDKEGHANTPEQQLQVMRDYIKKVASRYHGKVHAWDVVNEIIGEDGNYRNTIWVQRIGSGDDVVKAAFQYAEKYAPDTELYYNDFNAWRPEKRDGIVRMIKMLQANGIRIDGVGIQAHWGLNYPEIDYIKQAIETYASLGIKVMISELDIDVLPLTKEGQIIGTGMLHPQYQLEEFETFLDPYQSGLPIDIQSQLTKRYQELFTLFYQQKDNIDRVTMWGVDDSMSWKNYYPIADRTNYPLLWNRDYSAKPAVKAILEIPKRAQ